MAAMLYSLSRRFGYNSRGGFVYNRIFFASISVCLILTVFLSSCGNSDKELSEYNSKSLGIEEIKNADINYTLGGNAKAKLTSPLMLRVQDASPYVEFPKTLHVDFFNETATIDSRLDALYGKYFELESKVFLRDSVKVIERKIKKNTF